MVNEASHISMKIALRQPAKHSVGADELSLIIRWGVANHQLVSKNASCQTIEISHKIVSNRSYSIRQGSLLSYKQ
jgi:hypothetical protein